MRDMARERWQQVARLLDEALELDGAARARFLDRACAGDAALRAELETLVAADAAADRFLETPAVIQVGAADPAPAEIPPDLAAALADRYPIERRLGAGGTATVYSPRSQARPVGRAQGAPPGADPLPRPRAVRARDQGRRPAATFPHPPAARFRRCRRAPLVHHAVRGGPEPARPPAAAGRLRRPRPCASRAKRRRGFSTPTTTESCTATSSRRICSSRATAARSSPTSGSPGRSTTATSG